MDVTLPYSITSLSLILVIKPFERILIISLTKNEFHRSRQFRFKLVGALRQIC